MMQASGEAQRRLRRLCRSRRDFDALAAEQARLEAIIAAAGTNVETQMEIAADACAFRLGMP